MREVECREIGRVAVQVGTWVVVEEGGDSLLGMEEKGKKRGKAVEKVRVGGRKVDRKNKS